MNEPADYLWDRSAADSGDAQRVQQLEQLLRGLAHDGRALQLEGRRPAAARRVWSWLLTAAAAAAVFVSLLWRPDERLQPGAAAREFTASASAVTVPLGVESTAVVAPGTTLAFVHWHERELLLRLARGEVAATLAPAVARVFVLDVANGHVAVDPQESARFRVRASANGSLDVAVMAGAVTFTAAGRTRFVPAGAQLLVRRDGRGTPLFDDAPVRLREVCGKFDGMKPDSPFVIDAAEEIARSCDGPRDALVLWHLLGDPEPVVRKVAEGRLRQLIGMPPGYDRGDLAVAPDVWLAFLRAKVWPRGQ